MKKKTILILAFLLISILKTHAQPGTLTVENDDMELPAYFKFDAAQEFPHLELLKTTNNINTHVNFTITNKRAAGTTNNQGASVFLLDYDYSINKTEGINKSSLILRNDDLNDAYISFWNYNASTFAPFNDSRLLEIKGSEGWARMNLNSLHATKMRWEFDGNKKMEINDQGQLSVNTLIIPTTLGDKDVSDYKLFVNGGVLATEVLVQTDWADFVFNKDYNLPTLKEVEAHIKKKGHLKDIPSAKEVEKNGISLGEMDSKLLQKIEELTLYVIQQQKEIEMLKKEIIVKK